MLLGTGQSNDEELKLTCFVRILVEPLPEEPAQDEDGLQDVVQGQEEDALVGHVNEPLGTLLGVDHVSGDAGHEDDGDEEPVGRVQHADFSGWTPLQREVKTNTYKQK